MAEEIENSTQKKKMPKGGVKLLLGGRLLASEKVMKQLPFVFFLVVLGLISITNRNWSEKTIRRIEVVQDSLKKLRAESVIHEAKLMEINSPSEVNRRVQERNIGLIEPKEPPMRIMIEKTEEAK